MNYLFRSSDPPPTLSLFFGVLTKIQTLLYIISRKDDFVEQKGFTGFQGLNPKSSSSEHL